MNIPENSKRVFKGVIYDVYHWEQKMFDGSTKTFERLERSDTATVIAMVGEKIILQEQTQPHRSMFLSLPGGRCEEKEDPLETAKRELLEETGYVSDEVFHFKKFEPVSVISWKNNFFIARDCQKIAEKEPDNGEKINNKLISFEEFLMLSEDERFRHKDLIPFLYHLRLHPDEQDAFKKILFGK